MRTAFDLSWQWFYMVSRWNDRIDALRRRRDVR